MAWSDDQEHRRGYIRRMITSELVRLIAREEIHGSELADVVFWAEEELNRRVPRGEQDDEKEL